MKERKKKLIFGAILACLLSISVLIAFRVFRKDASVSTMYMSCIFAFDVTDLKQQVGFSDYVFVGYVNEITDTTYDTCSFPETHYSISIVTNIKGDLEEGSVVSVIKEGGLSRDGSCYVLYTDDELPTVGGYYVFSVKADLETTYVASGPSSTANIGQDEIEDAISEMELDGDVDYSDLQVVNAIENTSVYNDYKVAYENEIPFDISNLGK